MLGNLWNLLARNHIFRYIMIALQLRYKLNPRAFSAQLTIHPTDYPRIRQPGEGSARILCFASFLEEQEYA